MRAALWPEDSADAHAAEIDVVLGQDHVWGFVAEADGGAPLGFAEVAIRAYANGCEPGQCRFSKASGSSHKHAAGASDAG
jgi:hypothetical protein